MVRVRCFVIGVGVGIRPGEEWARGWAIFFPLVVTWYTPVLY